RSAMTVLTKAKLRIETAANSIAILLDFIFLSSLYLNVSKTTNYLAKYLALAGNFFRLTSFKVEINI
ncbi:MAG TPA: hypothetical protein VMW42_07395, partial [Desulfatiglandales bacterium]|nr:hypothetical protein [Desulfatiglandales bacterium]